MPLFTIILLGLTYVLVGWQLAIRDIVWFVGVLISVVTISFAWKSNPWVNEILVYLSQIVLVALSTSLLIILTVSFPLLLTLMILPILVTFLAWQEMQVLGLTKVQTWNVLLPVIAVGIGVGELIDFLILPSIKY